MINFINDGYGTVFNHHYWHWDCLNVSNFQQMNHIFNLVLISPRTSITLGFNDQLSTLEGQLRETLMATELTKHSIQTSGLNDIVTKTEEMTAEKRNELFTAIEKNGPFDVLVDIIGLSIMNNCKPHRHYHHCRIDRDLIIVHGDLNLFLALHPLLYRFTMLHFIVSCCFN